MTNSSDKQNRALLQRIARRAMVERGLLPDFSSQALAELDELRGPAAQTDKTTRDLRHLLWCSIDNDDSRDLDQLTVAEVLPDKSVRVLVAVADVDSLVRKDSAIDEHARRNTTSVYTAARIFPMLPEKLSTDLTSLNYASERHALIIELVVGEEGALLRSDVYGALVWNRAKLAYDSVAAWLEGAGAIPPEIPAVPGLEENLRLQDRIAQRLKTLRHEHGALTLETVEARLVFDADEVKDLQAVGHNRAKDIIEDLMIAANGVTARFLSDRGLPSFRRVVRTPKRWDRIRELALDHGKALPAEPDARSLEAFLTEAQAVDPLRFPDLSLAVIKLLGAGEYVLEVPGGGTGGHFGLAVQDYSHSTAPNRRYPDLITQRLLKAAISGQRMPYENGELSELAKHCTEKEDAAKKVERQVRKSAAAMLLEHRLGEQFDAFVTGAAEKGTWVRLLSPPIEGRLTTGFEGVDVGQRVRVQLMRTDVERGYIDFRRVGEGKT
ncbi:MAG TPA: RNB domain-containing ribonuclease [Nitrospirota bacterium]|nr:RNB domain-containing ribonuclease [Nitrospirota bacterium]